LLVRGNSLLILDLGLDIVDRVRGLNLKSDSLARKGLDEAIGCQSRIRRLCNFAIGGGAVCGSVLGSLHLHCLRGSISKDRKWHGNQDRGRWNLLIAVSTSLSWCRWFEVEVENRGGIFVRTGKRVLSLSRDRPLLASKYVLIFLLSHVEFYVK
jgi:hypothetical protein